MATVTVGELATLVGAGDASAMAERIKHWTREQLLTPVDKHHEGAGKHRRYHPDTAYLAAILAVFADAGLHVASQRYLVDAFSMVRDHLENWKQARTKGRSPRLFLEVFVVVGPDSKNMVTSVHGGAAKKPSALIAELKQDRPDLFFTTNTRVIMTISVNLGELFERVWSLSRQAGIEESPA